MTAYLLDANVFIQAKNLHYGFDFCPAFWDWLLKHNAAGKVISIDRVGDELQAGDDELAEWATAHAEDMFMPPDATLTLALQQVSQWAITQDYKPGAVATFLQVADYWLVAHALAHGDVIVTHEVPRNSINRIKVPDACLALNIRCMTPFEMLRNERARFVLG